MATLEKALAIDGGDADSLYALGTALVQTGEPDQAVQVLRLAVAFVPTGWCDPYQRLGEAYTALNQAAGVTWASGMVSFCDGRFDEAATTLKSLTTGTMKADALLGLALVTSTQGDNAAAIDYYRQVLALDPTNQSAAIGSTASAEGPRRCRPRPRPPPPETTEMTTPDMTLTTPAGEAPANIDAAGGPVERRRP